MISHNDKNLLEEEDKETIVISENKLGMVKMNTSRRPNTPHINLFTNKCETDEVLVRNIKKRNDSENIMKNFSSFMKQIIETQNENFLSGETKVVEFMISKYLKMNIEEIKKLEKLSIKINSDFGLLNSFGDYLPNLKELKLNDSLFSSISDIGTSFRNLRILNVTNCGLTDLSGIICFSNLEVLEAAENSISDLIELEMCSSITKLNLRKNKIESEDNISFLSNLSELNWLNLLDNPIRKLTNYEILIKENLPSLVHLDQESEQLNKKELVEVESNEDKKFFESQSTFTSSPTSTNQRPVSSTSSNFFTFSKMIPRQINLNQSDVHEDSFNKDFSASKSPVKFRPSDNFEKLNFNLTHRGKSQNKLIIGNEESSKLNLGLKPVIKKKEAPLEIKTFRNAIEKDNDEELRSEIIKNLDKNATYTNGFKMKHFNVSNGFNSTTRLNKLPNQGLEKERNSLNTGSQINTLNMRIVKGKEKVPMKLKPPGELDRDFNKTNHQDN